MDGHKDGHMDGHMSMHILIITGTVKVLGGSGSTTLTVYHQIRCCLLVHIIRLVSTTVHILKTWLSTVTLTSSTFVSACSYNGA